ncbi:LysR family transcriptional regulator [Shewanella marisflavi]|uniref:LysR family transcriptional regulator n=1 Tax=Shewanella marisflavi TaxID=260364 RepID=A0AAC9TXC5_9GAMM|nr:LysR family transcriptional regulator [Shewanella marisflavi]ASJ95771.1 LysR family transcriptional regulator [Shewanella marisflavi]
MSKINANTLFNIKVFVLLFDTLSATEVAQQLGVASSKVSRSLKALRHAFDEPLFVRRQHGFEHTPFAQRIYPHLKRMLALSEASLSCSDKDTEQAHTELTIACPPPISLNLLSYLQDKASQLKQRYTFNIKPCSNDIDKLLIRQDVDLAITLRAFNSERLASDFVARANAYVLVGNQQHPIFHGDARTDVEAILQYPYISFNGHEFELEHDPLALYALDHGLTINLVAKVCLLSDLMIQLERSDALTLICYRDAVAFLCAKANLSAMALPEDQNRLLNRRADGHSHYLTKLRDAGNRPPWLEQEIASYIQGNVILNCEGASHAKG